MEDPYTDDFRAIRSIRAILRERDPDPAALWFRLMRKESGLEIPPEEWFADQKYWEDNRSFIWSEKRIAMSKSAAKLISELLRMKPGDSILDLACGFGRHSLALSGLGYKVTGVDLNPGFIEEASGKARDIECEARFLCADMREFIEQDSYDHIILMYNSFGYFQDPRDDRNVIRNCIRSLRPGGGLLLQGTPREFIKTRRPSGRGRYWYEHGDGTIRLEEATVSEDWSWNTTSWIVIRGADRREYSYGMRLYSTEEYIKLLSSCGFSSIVSYGGLEAGPYEIGRDQLTLAARKPEERIT